MKRSAAILLATATATSAWATPGDVSDPLLYSSWERPSASVPLTIGGTATVGGGVDLDLANGLDVSPAGPLVEADVWLDVFQLGATVDRGLDRALVRVLNRTSAARDIQYTAVGLEGGRHWGFMRIGLHYRHALSKKGRLVTGSTSRLLFGGTGTIPLALESWYDLGYRFTTKNVAVTPTVYGWLGVGQHADLPSQFSSVAGAGISLKISLNEDLGR